MKRRSFLKGTIGATLALAFGIKPEPKRTLSAGWTIGPTTYESYHSIEAEQELIKLMSEEMAKEIDREILSAIGGVS